MPIGQCVIPLEMNQYDKTGKSVIGVQKVSDSDTERYGIIDPSRK